MFGGFCSSNGGIIDYERKRKSWLDKYIRDFGGLLRQLTGGAIFTGGEFYQCGTKNELKYLKTCLVVEKKVEEVKKK